MSTEPVNLEMIDGMHFLACPDLTGDDRTQWDPSDPEQVAKAQAKFDEFKKKGMRITKIDANGEHEAMHVFDPSVARMVAELPMVGG